MSVALAYTHTHTHTRARARAHSPLPLPLPDSVDGGEYAAVDLARERERERERESNRAAKDKQKDQRKMGKATWRTRRQDRRGRGRVLRVCQRGTASISVLLSRSFRPSYPISFPRQFPSVNSIIYRYTLRRRPLFRFSLFPLFRCRRLHRRLFNLIGVLLPPSTLSCFLSLSLSLFFFSLSRCI